MSARFVALCAVGLAGSLFLGYCVYFDRKRRMDPDYKKKILAREPQHTFTLHWRDTVRVGAVSRYDVILIQGEGKRRRRLV